MIRRTWLQMGMPISVGIVDPGATESDIDAVWVLLDEIDRRFSPYRPESEVSRLNRGELARDEISAHLADVLARCEQTRVETSGFFNAQRNGTLDPSGLVKGLAIQRAADLLTSRGFEHGFVDAGGDIQTFGLNQDGEPWRVGVRNPFNRDEVVKVLAVSGEAVATSGTAIRGDHIYDPFTGGRLETDLVSLTVVGPRIYDADRFATAAFAMGREGLEFIAARPDLEAYAVTADGMAVYTEGFAGYVR